MTTIKVSAYRWVPPFAQGLVRDLRVRWALEEARLPYEERLLGFGEQSSDSFGIGERAPLPPSEL